MTDHLRSNCPFPRATLLALALASMSGCADLRWDRAIYQGIKFSGEHCAIKQRAGTAPCADLPSRNQYERERASLKPAVVITPTPQL